ncbi:MAG: hypothetical protein ACOX0F_05985 [Syntrophomonadaceae bacterium]|jgi:hypothetical protein
MGSRFWDHYPLVVEGMLQALPPGFTFYLSNLEKVVFKAPADAVPGVKVGEPYVPHGPSGTAIRTEQVVNMELDISYYGEPIKVFAAPIFDDEEPELLLGAFAISLSRDSAFSLRNLANTHQVGMAEMGIALKRMSMDSHDIKINNTALYQRIQNVQQTLHRICADQPPNEEITAQVDAMKAELNKAIAESQTIVQRSEEQASLMQIISNRVKELADMIEELNRIAHEI